MIRGTALLATRAYLDKKHGQGAFDRAVMLLRPEHAAVWRAIPLAHEWYSHEAVLALDDAAASLYGPDFYDEIGAFVAEYDLNFIHRFLLKFTSPLWILDKGAKMWTEFYNSGKWTIVRGTHPKTLVGTLENFAIVSVRQCRMVTAFVRKAGELTGANKIRVEHPQCRARGGTKCVFTAAW